MATIQKHELALGRWFGVAGVRNKPGELGAFGIGGYRQQRRHDIAAEQRANAIAHALAWRQLQQGTLFIAQRESAVGMAERQPVHHIRDVARFAGH